MDGSTSSALDVVGGSRVDNEAMGCPVLMVISASNVDRNSSSTALDELAAARELLMNAARSVIVVAPTEVEDIGASTVVSELKGAAGCAEADTVPRDSSTSEVLGTIGARDSEVIVDTT